jgi:lysophospholipase L1-like esterase
MDEGKKYSPDIVVVAFYLGNDPINCASSQSYKLNKPVFVDLQLSLANVPVPKPPAQESDRIKSRANPYVLSARIIKELATECQKVGAELVLMKFGVFQDPTQSSVQKTNAFFEQQLQTFAMKFATNLHYLDLDKKFEPYTRAQLTEGVDDGHWNPFGHAVVAEVLEDYLTESGLLK